MINGLHGRDKRHFCGKVPTGVGVTIKTREIAAGNFQPDAMASAKDITGRAQINGIGIHCTWFDAFGLGRGGAIARPNDAIGKVLGKTIGMHIDQLGRKIRIDR